MNEVKRGVFMSKYDYVVMGNDKRQVLLYQMLSKKYSCIHCENADLIKISDVISDADNILLPIPMCKGEILNIQVDESQIKNSVSANDLLQYIKSGQHIFAGCINDKWEALVNQKGAYCHDYMKEKRIAIYNSIATAEGTIAEIISTCAKNLHNEGVIVLGYGVCAKTLADKLRGMSAKVCIVARNDEALMDAFANGYESVKLENLKEIIGKYKLIVNTVPVHILSKDILENIQPDTHLYEIASFPYGADMDVYTYAKNECGMKLHMCPSLPAKYAPESSANILKEIIVEKIGGNIS